VELDGIAARPAAEAVEEALLRVDAEGGGLLLVDGAEPLVAAAGLAEARVLGGDRHDVRGVAHRLDELGGEMDVA
jgi:hypothetical protein